MHRLFLNSPVSKKLVAILWIFLVIVVSLMAISYLTIENLSAARAYVGGEGLWSKAQKQAVYDLLQYSTSHSERDYEKYQQELLVPLGDRLARLELEKPTPDMAVVRRGFIQGRNNLDDVESMATFFRRFRRSTYMSEAIRIWAQGDNLIDELQRCGEQLHSEISSPRPNSQRVAEIARQVDAVANGLTPLEDRFSYALGAGARRAKHTFLVIIFGATAMSVIAGSLFTFVMLRYMRQTEERYKQLIDTANDVILVLDAETGIIVDANARSGEVLGRAVSEIVGMPGDQLIVKEDREAYLLMMRITASGRALAGQQLHIQHPDKRPRTAEVNTSLTEFGGKKIVQGIFRDITERMRLEEEVRQSQKMEVVGRLAGGIAHDFNNLLMVILLQASRMTASIDQPLLRDQIGTIRSAAEKATSLTKQLLAFGRKQVLVLQVLDLNDLLVELKEMLTTLQTEQIQVVVTPSAHPLPVKVDPGQIEQVVMNLAVNARDAMPSGGVLRITVALAGGNATALGNKESSGFSALIEVSDTGIGMNSETKSHLFEPFFTTKPPGKGTGLGLPTVYGIVRQSGGTIEVKSAPGEGATFRVYLPLVEPAVGPRRAVHVPTSVSGGSETILLAEDQPSIRSALRDVLQAKGYKVLEAENGSEALEIAQSHPGSIEVLVTDIVMPNLRGLDLAERVAQSRPHICVIFMSGYSEEALVENRLLSERSAALIQKPFDPEKLARMIRDSIDNNSRYL